MSSIVLDIKDIHKSYGRHKVLYGVSFSVEKGTMVGVVGENGSGKSTLLKILSGELKLQQGKVIAYDSIGYCPQIPVLNETLTVEQHLKYFKEAYTINSLDYAYELIKELNYEQYVHTPISDLSGGTRQKINLTIALMQNPGLLLLDEPYQGFDWETYLKFWNIVEKLRNDGKSLLIISHMFFEQKRFNTLYQLKDGKTEYITPQGI